MRNRRLIRSLFYAMLLLAVAPGCLSFHGYRPVPVEVRDAETKQPIPGVEVKVSYPLETSTFAPGDVKETTGADGIARLQAAPYGRAGVMVEISGHGYMSEYKYLTVEEVEAVEPAHWFEDVRRRPARLVMEMYANPAPVIDFVVPVGYRGQFKAKVQVQAGLPSAVGQRLFRFEVPEAGEVIAAGPALFQHVTPTNVRVKFADNAPLSHMAKESAVGYWVLKCDGTSFHFLVGTQRDYDYYRSTMQSGAPTRNSAPSDGKGRRGRKGNPAPTDSSALGVIQ
jgi:hypothetical protein